MNKYLVVRLKAQKSEKALGGGLPKLTKPLLEVVGSVGHARADIGFDSFDSAHTRRVLNSSSSAGIPHLRYGHDEFSLIRLPILPLPSIYLPRAMCPYLTD